MFTLIQRLSVPANTGDTNQLWLLKTLNVDFFLKVYLILINLHLNGNSHRWLVATPLDRDKDNNILSTYLTECSRITLD